MMMMVDRFIANLEDRLTAKLVNRLTAKLVDCLTAKLVDCLTAEFVSRLTARQVNAKPQSLRLRKTPPPSCFRTFEPWSCRRNTQAKTMTKRRDERPAKIVGQNYVETTIAQTPRVTEDNEERNGLTEQQKQRESNGKRMIRRLNETSGRQENAVLNT